MLDHALGRWAVPATSRTAIASAWFAADVDHSLATWAQGQREPFARGLDELNREARHRWPGAGRFAALAPARQIDLLHSVEHTPFFQTMRVVTIAGTFANPSWGGNSK